MMQYCSDSSILPASAICSLHTLTTPRCWSREARAGLRSSQDQLELLTPQLSFTDCERTGPPPNTKSFLQDPGKLCPRTPPAPPNALPISARYDHPPACPSRSPPPNKPHSAPRMTLFADPNIHSRSDIASLMLIVSKMYGVASLAFRRIAAYSADSRQAVCQCVDKALGLLPLALPVLARTKNGLRRRHRG